ncbi:hypothetical protein ABEB36_015648 [Hypothenemus hampei]|uniref:Uncharacterized protein n=1 Tax=Hypothenemus hampei TaxID=57062 RepID=A0ABD1DZ33_HYPHA
MEENPNRSLPAVDELEATMIVMFEDMPRANKGAIIHVRMTDILTKLKKNVSVTSCIDCSAMHRQIANNPQEVEKNTDILDKAKKHIEKTHKDHEIRKPIHKKEKKNSILKKPDQLQSNAAQAGLGKGNWVETEAERHPKKSKGNEEYITPLKSTKLKHLIRKSSEGTTHNKYLSLRTGDENETINKHTDTEQSGNIDQSNRTIRNTYQKDTKIPPIIIDGKLTSHKEFLQVVIRGGFWIK